MSGARWRCSAPSASNGSHQKPSGWPDTGRGSRFEVA
jgi:hypothetical protein